MVLSSRMIARVLAWQAGSWGRPLTDTGDVEVSGQAEFGTC